MQQAASLQSLAGSMSSAHAGVAWPQVPGKEAMWQQFLATQQAEQMQHMQHMQHKQLQQQQQNQQMIVRWEHQQHHKPLLRPLECQNGTI